jgi:ribose 1,5-bisphosphokinase PhnN
MPAMLSPLYSAEHPEISDRGFEADKAAEFEQACKDFSVNWVVHRHETQPVEVEHSVIQDLDRLVKTCRRRFSEMKLKYPNTPPDGFLVLDGAGDEVRRWFESARPKE